MDRGLPLRGIDVQFFAALIAPLDDRPEEKRLADKRIDRTYPVLIQPNARDARFSDISFRIASRPVELKEKDSSVSHKYAFFVGPKRKELLDPEPLAAARVLDYGDWFGLIARGMHRVLDVFHQLGLPYVLAIISLTVLVRGLMFPLSRKQAISAAKMKDLQPKLAELKARYGDDKEKLARAQMELWRRHKINPLGRVLAAVLPAADLYWTVHITEHGCLTCGWLDSSGSTTLLLPTRFPACRLSCRSSV